MRLSRDRYFFLRDALTLEGVCLCDPSFEPSCVHCEVPGTCLACNPMFTLVDGKCGAPPPI